MTKTPHLLGEKCAGWQRRHAGRAVVFVQQMPANDLASAGPVRTEVAAEPWQRLHSDKGLRTLFQRHEPSPPPKDEDPAAPMDAAPAATPESAMPTNVDADEGVPMGRIEAPDGTVAEGRTWQGPPPSEESQYRFGCSSIVGSQVVIEEGKDNDDFAFCLQTHDVSGEVWLLCGVADGVGNAAWARRAAKHSCSSFIRVIEQQLRQDAGPQWWCDPKTLDRLSEELCRLLLQRLNADLQIAVAQRVVDPSWQDPDFFRRYFFDVEDAAKQRQGRWFQTTLQAGALGPCGGVLIFLGDGMARLDLLTGGELGWQHRELDPPPPPAQPPGRRSPPRLVSLNLTPEVVRAGMLPIDPSGALGYGLVLATDGVSKSPKHGLLTAHLENMSDCGIYLRALASRPEDEVQADNLSVAFARREARPWTSRD